MDNTTKIVADMRSLAIWLSTPPIVRDELLALADRLEAAARSLIPDLEGDGP